MKLTPTPIRKSLSLVGTFLTRNSPAILTGISVAGVISTAAATVKATNDAQLILDEARRRKKAPVSKSEAVELVWKHYIPPILLGGTTIACIFGLNSIHLKRQAALAGLYSIADASLKEYQTKVLNEVGPKKAQKILDDIAQDTLDKNPLSTNYVHETPAGDTLCYDVLSGRYFKSDMESIKRARNDFNHRLNTDMSTWLNVNDFYYELGLDPIELGDYMGWTPDQLMEIHFPTKMADNGQPCLVMDFRVKPRFLYNR